MSILYVCYLCFYNDTPISDIYTLSLHDALPIYLGQEIGNFDGNRSAADASQESRTWRLHNDVGARFYFLGWHRSEEHTSELQSHSDLVCRLLLEKKKQTIFR